MRISEKIRNFSRNFFILSVIAYLADHFMNGALSSILLLGPDFIIQDFQLWRLVSFSLMPASFENIVLMAFSFHIFSFLLEDILHQVLYPILVLLIAALQGILFTLVFWQSDISLFGTEGISFFVLALFTALKPTSRLRFFHAFTVKSYKVTAFVALTWIILKSIVIFAGNDTQLWLSAYNMIFGITGGLFTYMQIKLFKKIRESSEKNPVIPSPEELSMAYISAKSRSMESAEQTRAYIPISDDPDINEEILNEILDKITEQGRNSLSPEEVYFLKEYSRQI